MNESGDATPSVRTDIVEIENEWARAIVANDPERFKEFTSNDWVIVSDRGVTTRAQFLSVVESGALAHSEMSAVGDYRVRVFGDAAVVTVRMMSVGEYRGQLLRADEWTTDVFERRAGRWLCVLTQVSAASPG